MGGAPQYDFEWDFRKAQDNRQKHGVSFEEAARVFLDRDHVSLFDEEHSVDEDRWITLGRVPAGDLLVLIHIRRPGPGPIQVSPHLGPASDGT